MVSINHLHIYMDPCDHDFWLWRNLKVYKAFTVSLADLKAKIDLLEGQEQTLLTGGGKAFEGRDKRLRLRIVN